MEPLGDLEFLRATVRYFKDKKRGTCSLCGDKREYDEREVHLFIEKLSLELCAYHEGVLLDKLLTNYLKRMNRERTVGFTGWLKKSQEEKSEQDRK